MRRCRTALAVLTILLVSFVVAGPASAGGPTSVLLVVPGMGQTASLYASDADYQELAELVGAFGPGDQPGDVDSSGTNHEVGTGVTVTWLMHDVQVWRVDRIYVAAEGGPWISTQTTLDGSDSIWDSTVTWHTAARGKELFALLDRLGVGPSGNTSAASGGSVTGGDIAADNPAPIAAADASTDSTTTAVTSGASGTGRWVWSLGGLILGVALSLAGMRVLPSSRKLIGKPATAQPGVEETEVDRDDRAAAPLALDAEFNWSATEELSSPGRTVR